MTAKRIQRQRTKGWRKPEGCINVTRPGKFGNPFRDMYGMVYYYSERRAKLGIDPWVLLCIKSSRHNAISFFSLCLESNEYIRHLHNALVLNDIDAEQLHLHFSIIANSLDELKGHDLCCFCPIDQNCHADTLLRLANL